jgi:hypothetical protein
MLNNGVTAGYRINRKFSALNQFRKLAYLSNEIVVNKIENSKSSI